MAQSNSVQPRRRFWRGTLVLSVAAAVLGALWIALRPTDEFAHPASGIVAVRAPVDSAAKLPVAPEGDGLPSPSATSPSPGMKHALALADSAVVRDVQVFSRQLGISCGEVSLTGRPSDFKRFFYIASMKTGSVDDGTEEFRSHVASVCLARS